MSDNNAKLITIYTEADLEHRLIEDIEKHGALGYTITNAKGKGSHGARAGLWQANANIRIEIVCNEELSESLSNYLEEKYYEHYAMVTYVSNIQVLRPEKFDITEK